MILDVIGVERCYARLGIGCVVGDGQGIGVELIEQPFVQRLGSD